jgi:hypothetical protein
MNRRTGVTLIELLLVAAFIGCGVIAAISGGENFGAIGYVGGFLVGMVGSFAASGAVLCLGFDSDHSATQHDVDELGIVIA